MLGHNDQVEMLILSIGIVVKEPNLIIIEYPHFPCNCVGLGHDYGVSARFDIHVCSCVNSLRNHTVVQFLYVFCIGLVLHNE